MSGGLTMHVVKRFKVLISFHRFIQVDRPRESLRVAMYRKLDGPLFAYILSHTEIQDMFHSTTSQYLSLSAHLVLQAICDRPFPPTAPSPSLERAKWCTTGKVLSVDKHDVQSCQIFNRCQTMTLSV